MYAVPKGLLPLQFGPFDAFLGALCIAAIASVIIFILIAVWVYRDAQTRGMDGSIWAIVFVLAGFFVPFVGGFVVLVIYLILRSEHPVMYPGGIPMAPYPSPYPPPVPPPETAPAAPPAVQAPCRTCGAPLRPGAAFCAHCGAKV